MAFEYDISIDSFRGAIKAEARLVHGPAVGGNTGRALFTGNSMDLQRQTCRRLHEEHEAVFELLRKLQRAPANSNADAAPDFLDPAESALLRDVRSGLEFEAGAEVAAGGR